uniref:Secreted protein n=1 Tax=Caenorhabditis tropicalis TaxID=1561998 RepID=A0A1I7T154_9PELO
MRAGCPATKCSCRKKTRLMTPVLSTASWFYICLLLPPSFTLELSFLPLRSSSVAATRVTQYVVFSHGLIISG